MVRITAWCTLILFMTTRQECEICRRLRALQWQECVVLDNTSKGYGYTANITVNAQPVDDLMLMLAYTHTESKEVSGLPGSDPISTWQGLNTIDGSNYVDAQRSQYVVPDKVIASVGYYIPFRHKACFAAHT